MRDEALPRLTTSKSCAVFGVRRKDGLEQCAVAGEPSMTEPRSRPAARFENA
jgi:hypothetical protein